MKKDMTRTKTHRAEHELRDQLLSIAVLISNKGTGSNLKAIIDALHEERLTNIGLRIVVSDKKDAQGLKHVVNTNIVPFVMERDWKKIDEQKKREQKREKYSIKLATSLNDNNVEVAIMAGFMTLLTESFFKEFKGVVLNIHPGDVPDDPKTPNRYPDGRIVPWNQGMMTEGAMSNFLDKPFAVSSIHEATKIPDFGKVFVRVATPVVPSEVVETLYPRHKLQEHAGLIKVLGGAPLRELVAQKKAA